MINDATSGHNEVPTTGRVNVFDGYFLNRDQTGWPTRPQMVTSLTTLHNLQYSLSGPDAKYFTITQSTGTPANPTRLVA